MGSVGRMALLMLTTSSKGFSTYAFPCAETATRAVSTASMDRPGFGLYSRRMR